VGRQQERQEEQPSEPLPEMLAKALPSGQQEAGYEDASCRGEPKLKLDSRLKPNRRHRKTGLENFKRAFSACMEAKGYSVK
jgi:hypothetical protein